ncbi:MAG: hypothetical protein Ta2B_00770 [Termitinemataceae bacterium]|nr:MAG: hypothetical protein Ta2B_00770 [Termitinemataceae bacterium]
MIQKFFKKAYFCFLIINSVCILQIISAQEFVAKEELKFLLDEVENIRKEKQSKIFTIDDLRGTYWLPDDSDKTIIYPVFADAYIFLNDLVIIIRTNRYTLPKEISDKTMFWFMLVENAIKYKSVGQRIWLTEKLSCYLEDTYLYIGDESYGFDKYRLEGTFSILDF